MATEAPNTLRSRARFRIIDMISEGPIKGLAEGLKSIYLNNTPIQAHGGSLNFKNFKEATDLIQLPKTKLPDSQANAYVPASAGVVSEATETVNVKVTKDSPEGSGSGDGSVVRTITDADLDAVRVTLRIPALMYQDLATGNSTGSNLQFKISVAPDGGDFVPINSSRVWVEWAMENEETDAGTMGLNVKCEAIHFNYAAYKDVIFKYAKKTGKTWGSWVTFKEFKFPASSPSSSQFGYWTTTSRWGASTNKQFEASVSGLVPGIYKIQILTTNCTATTLSKQQYAPGYVELDGKCVAPYDASYIVPLPQGGAPWTVKVERLTDDRLASNYQDDLYWLSYTELLYEKFYWPNLAGFELRFNADDFDSIPERAYDVFGLMVSIPSNYDPYTRTYTGIWDGTFTTDWTDNPAWILFDIIQKKRYGLGNNIPASYLETLKWSLYSIAQYCDELVVVDDTVSEPRYTCSCCINSQQEAYDLLNTIVSTFRGMLYPVGEGLMAVADKLTDPVINVGPANVIDGMFVYRGPARKTIHTAAYVTWNNPDDGYKLNTALYENREGILRYGYKIDKINAVGACSKSLAIRLAKWKVLTEVMAPDTVTYRASFDHLNVMPGDIVNISDPAYTNEELIGRILSITDNEDTTHTIKLDRSVARIGGDESILQITLPDQTILSIDVSTVTTTSGTEIIVPSASLTTMPVIGTMWLLSKETVRPRMWRVFNIEEAEKNIYEVSASLVDPEKWDEIEGTHNFEPADYTGFPTGELPAPTGLHISEFLKQSGSSIVCCVNLSWTEPNDARAAFYRAEYRKGTEPWKSTEPVLCQNPSIDIFDITPDTYDFRVQAQDSTGLMKSDWTYLTSQTLLGKQKKPENVADFAASVEKFGILLTWTPVSDIDIDYYEIRSGASWAAGTVISQTKSSEFKYEDATTGDYTFWIAAKDTSGNYSATPATIGATVSAQATPTVAATAVNGGIQLTITGTTTRGFKAYEIQRRESPAGAESTINSNVLTKIFTDSDIATLGYVKSWQYRARALDQNGSASGWSSYTSATTPKQIENNDITANQIVAKDFRTALDVGETVDGVRFTADGIEMWQDGSRKVFIPVTGDPEFTGLLTAGAGHIGGWEILPTYLQSSNIKLDSAGLLQTLDFVSGHKGWKINQDGNAELNNLRARGAVKTVVFEKDEISVVGGKTLIRPAGLITSTDTDWLTEATEEYFEDCWTLLNSILGESNPYVPEVFANYQEYYDAELLYFNTLNDVLAPDPSPEFEPFIGHTVITTENADQFNVGDFIRIKDGLSNDFWGEVINKSGNDLIVEGKYGDLFNITAGQIIVNYGIAGSGGILLDGQTPLIDVYTHNGLPWSETDIKVRIGNLNGWGDIVSDVYGIAIGNASGEYLIYDSTSSRLRIKGAIVLGADSSVDGTYIDDDSIETRHFKAQSVTADIVDATVVKTTELQIYGKNRCIDPAFDGVPYSATFTNPGFSAVGQRLGKWEVVACTGSVNSYGYHKLSTWIGSIVSDVGTNALGWAIGILDKTAAVACRSDIFAANPSTPYYLSIGTHNGTGRVPTGTLKAEWYTSSKTLISTSTVATFSPTATPTRHGGSATSPSNAALCRVRIELAADATNGGGSLIFSAVQIEEGTAATTWVNREQGTITADRVVTGQVKSLNYSTTTGSLLDLDNGNFTVGGSTAPVFALNSVEKTGQLSGFSFNVTDMTACSTTNAIGISTDTDKKAFWAGSETPADGKFFVGHDGFLHAEYGNISGFTITDTDLTAGSSSSSIGISTDTDKKAFWAGSDTPIGAPFYVAHDGTGKLGLLTFTATEFAHYSYDRNYDPVDPDYLIRTFAIAPNVDGWKGAAMHFQDAYGETAYFLDSTKFVFSSFLGDSIRCMPYGAKTQADPILFIGNCISTDYALVTNGKIEGYLSNLSDKRIKKDFTKTNTLHKLMQLDVSEWSYDEEAIYKKENEKRIEEAIKCENKIPISQIPVIKSKNHRHIGPTAKEFNELFGVSGGNPDSIGVGDQIGVTMRAIQELAAIVFEQAEEIAELRKALNLPEKQQKTGDVD